MSDQISKKCNCGKENKITCPTCSVLKMVIMLKNKQHHLKLEGPNGKRSNPVWYNHLSKNRKSFNDLIDGMIRRFNKKTEYTSVTNKLLFYDNKTKKLVHSHTV
ncbi:hypothetical protein ABMY20_15255 [Tenacibaculum sp. SSH1-16]|uniref:hypothetical protein n=1 Tax=Tenacibaculum sp. SSH1-16 TaxID=3136667 RepID=UPI0032C44629